MKKTKLLNLFSLVIPKRFKVSKKPKVHSCGTRTLFLVLSRKNSICSENFISRTLSTYVNHATHATHVTHATHELALLMLLTLLNLLNLLTNRTYQPTQPTQPTNIYM